MPIAEHPDPRQDGWDTQFDRVEGDGRGLERPLHLLSARQIEYNEHIKRWYAQIQAEQKNRGR